MNVYVINDSDPVGPGQYVPIQPSPNALDGIMVRHRAGIAFGNIIIQLTESGVRVFQLDSDGASEAYIAAQIAIAEAYTDTQVLAGVNTAKAYADSLVVGLWDDRGNYNPTATSTYPVSGGSGAAGALKKGDIWTISGLGVGVTHAIGTKTVQDGDTVRALIDTPGTTDANFAIQEANLGYVPENVINKDTDATMAANSDTKYPSQKAVKTALAGKQADLGFVPVEQGGTGTAGNKVYLGWGPNSGGGGAGANRLRLQVDATLLGDIVTDFVLFSALTALGTLVTSPDAISVKTMSLTSVWNMDTDDVKFVSTGLTTSQIKGVFVKVAGIPSPYIQVNVVNQPVQFSHSINTGDITIERLIGGVFDDPAYNAAAVEVLVFYH